MEARSLSHPTRVYPSWASQIAEVGYIRLRGERGGVIERREVRSKDYDLWLGRTPSPGRGWDPPSPKGRGNRTRALDSILMDQTLKLAVQPPREDRDWSAVGVVGG